MAKKYKKNNGDLVEGVEVILQHDEKAGTVYLVIRAPATKNTIFAGLLLKGKNEVRLLKEKSENMEITAFVVKAKKVELNRVKLQFDSAQQGAELYS